MSGHSKWATTKHQKFAADAKRGAAFTKLANMISIAAREGGDPEFNFKLRLAVERARAASMPKDNIERAIARGSGKGEGANAIEELTYEAYGPGGVAMIITFTTDNKLRAYTDVRTVLSKHGGHLAEGGAVSFQFDRKGVLVVQHAPEEAEEVQLAAIDLGADDVQSEGDLTRIITPMPNLQKVRQAISDTSYTIQDTRLEWIPKITHVLSPDDQTKLDNLVELLDALDDVSDVSTNLA